MPSMNSFVVALLVTLFLVWAAAARPPAAANTARMPRTTLAPTEYWQAVLPETPMPQAIRDLLTQSTGEEDSRKVAMSYGYKVEDLRKVRTSSYVSQDEADLKTVSISYKSKGEEDTMSYGSQGEDLRTVSISYKSKGEKGTKSYGSQGEEDLRTVSTSYTSKGEEDTISYGSQGEEDLRTISVSYKSKGEKDTMSYGSQGEEDLRTVSTSYKSKGEEDTMSYGSQGEDGLRTVSISYKSKGEEDTKSYGSQGEEDLRTVSISYKSKGEKDTMSYGSQDQEDLRTVGISYKSKDVKDTMSYGSQGEEDLRTVSISYKSKGEEDTMSYGSQGEEDLRTVNISYKSKGEEDTKSYGSQGEEDLRTVSISYKSKGEEDTKSYGSQDENLRTVSISYKSKGEKDTMSYGSQSEEDLKTVSISYKPKGEEDIKSYGSQSEEDLKTVSISYKSKGEENTKSYGSQGKKDIRTVSTSYKSKGNIHDHAVHSHNSGNKLADVFFFHHALRPGSVITPIIPPTTSLPSLLPRREADALPFSTKHFADILAMFAPASNAMAKEIWSTLDTCENPRPLPGEKAACATSLESLAKHPAVLLGRRKVRAYSGDMPTDPAGTPAQRGRYNVTAVRRLSDSLTAATCHDLTYPYAVFYCHTTNPMATYLVELVAQDGKAPTMEALAVCHLDTSLWSPRQPFLLAHSLKPGDAVVCHFLSKLSIVWVPAGEQGGMHEAQ